MVQQNAGNLEKITLKALPIDRAFFMFSRFYLGENLGKNTSVGPGKGINFQKSRFF
jgi:hypothetical protein